MSTSQSELMNRFKGCFYGLSVGDSLQRPDILDGVYVPFIETVICV